MPVNSFENYPLSWKPDKAKLKRPFYKSLSNLLIDDILNGSLKPNTILPPQRELADYLDFNLSTITKAYNLCRLYGFVYGQIGKGTFVSANKTVKDSLFIKPDTVYELALIEPFYEFDHLTLDAAKDVISKKSAVELLQYNAPLGTESQLSMAKKYLSSVNLNISINRLAIFPGAQNSLAVILLALFKMGDIIAVDTYTYPNFRKLSNSMGIQLIAVESDDVGMIPVSLNSACCRYDIKGVFLMPACSNPTNITMSLERIKELSEVIRSHDILLIEDETYAFVLGKAIPPFASIIPENTIYVNGLSKALSAGLRIAFVSYPDKYKERILETAMNINLNNVSINAEIVSKMIENGIAERMICKKKEQSVLRNTIYNSIFHMDNNNQGFFQWLKLPEKLNSEEFEILAENKGLRVLGSHHFLVGNNNAENYIRISLTSVKSANELIQALQLLKSLIDC